VILEKLEDANVAMSLHCAATDLEFVDNLPGVPVVDIVRAVRDSMNSVYPNGNERNPDLHRSPAHLTFHLKSIVSTEGKKGQLAGFDCLGECLACCNLGHDGQPTSHPHSVTIRFADPNLLPYLQVLRIGGIFYFPSMTNWNNRQLAVATNSAPFNLESFRS